MVLDDNCTVVIRYWHNGKIGQRIAVYQNLDAAMKKKEFIIAQLQKAGAEYFIEYLPRFGDPIVIGTIYGMNQHGGSIKQAAISFVVCLVCVEATQTNEGTT